MSQHQTITVEFNGQQIFAVLVEGKPYVAVKQISDNIGLQWTGQLERIKRHSVMNEGIRVIRTPSNGGDQDATCLPLSMLNGWLFGIKAGSVKDEIRDKVIQYQRECFDVLYQHFMPTVAAIDYTRINPAQAQALKELVNAISRRSGKHHQTIWTAFQSRFEVNSYLELAADRFEEARSYLGGKPMESKPAQAQGFDIEADQPAANVWPVDPTSPVVRQAMASAALLSAHVQTIAFEQFSQDAIFDGDRWLLNFVADDRSSGKTRPHISRIDQDACIMSPERFLKALVEPNGLIVRPEALRDFILEATKRQHQALDYWRSRAAEGKPVQLRR